MSVNVTSSRDGGLSDSLTQRQLGHSLHMMSEESADLVRNVVAREFMDRFDPDLFSEETRKKYPFLDDPDLAERYVSAIKVETTEDGSTVYVDSQELMGHGYPANLPRLFEYGAADFPPIPHWMSVVIRFTNQVANDLARKADERFQG